MGKYVLEFDRGGIFEVKFLEDAAPKTVEAFKAALPLYGGCLQARYAGEEFFFNAPMVTVGEENTVPPYHGAIAFNSDPEWRAVCIYYGPSIACDGDGYNLFAEISGDLDNLNAVGLRIWKHGEEYITFKKVEE